MQTMVLQAHVPDLIAAPTLAETSSIMLRHHVVHSRAQVRAYAGVQKGHLAYLAQGASISCLPTLEADAFTLA